MTVVRIGERRPVLPRRDRVEIDRHALSTRALERELDRTRAVGHVQPVEHLGNEREVGREPSQGGRIVVRHERTDELEHASERHALDRDQTATDDSEIACLVDDEDPVCEVVQPQRDRGGARCDARGRAGTALCARSAGRAAR